jgi:predicted esterase
LGATLNGRSVGLSAALLGGVLYCSVGYWNREWFKRNRARIYAVLLPVSLLLYLVPTILAPSGGAGGSRVRNCFLRGQGKFPRYSPWNVIPEVDQVKVGTSLLPFGDPYTDFAKAARMRSLLLPIYGAMRKDADFQALGSVMVMAYREVFRMEFRTGHYYVFLPEAKRGRRLPCLIFLHGLGGNRKSHLWVLSKMSTHMKCAVIAPTFGLGNWDKAGGAELVVDVAREALATHALDPERLFLLGYSNGAMGVTRAAVKEPELFRGLIYLSPIIEDEFFWSSEFLAHKRDLKILFLHGGRDRRIPRSSVEGTVASLEQLRCEVRLKIYDDEDHFLILSQPEAVLGDIMQFMTAEEYGPSQKNSSASRRTGYQGPVFPGSRTKLLKQGECYIFSERAIACEDTRTMRPQLLRGERGL